MKKKPAKKMFEMGSGNVFVDLGFPPEEAAELHAKAGLTRRIEQRIKELGLTQVKAAKLLGISQPDVSLLMRGRHTRFSVDKLMALLRSLDLDTEIVIRTKKGKTAQLSVVQAA
jgi:predicted XRE-type DNA-binding protein